MQVWRRVTHVHDIAPQPVHAPSEGQLAASPKTTQRGCTWREKRGLPAKRDPDRRKVVGRQNLGRRSGGPLIDVVQPV
jgi:hypothetical protein